MRIATAFLLLTLVAGPALGQTAGDCTTGTAQNELDVNNVFARVFNTGSLFFGNATVSGDGYLVPQNTGRSPIFASGLWVGGLVGGTVRTAAARYDNFEFWPGPLGEDGRPVNPDDCSAYDRIYRVSRADIDDYENGGTPTADLAEWPVGLGAPTVDADGEPVEATSLDQTIDLEAGERPEINDADQALWWIMNDVGGDHESSGSQPLGIEVRVLAYAYDRPGYETSTFYDFGVTYRGDASVEDAYVGFFSDPDLGDPSDDYVGSDPARGLAFAYNADNSDNGGLNGGYGTPPPAVGYDILRSPEGPNDEPLGATSVTYFKNKFGAPTSDPSTKEGYYNHLRGLWKDGTPITVGGDGYMTGGDVTRYVFPADPPAFWSEFNVDGAGTSNLPGDRRFLISSGPVTLEPGEEQTFTVGILWALGNSNLDSVTALKALSDAIQADFDPSTAGEDGAPQTGFALAKAFPNPFAERTMLTVELAEAGHATVEVFDVLGRRVGVLLDGPVPAGAHSVTWTPEARLPSGVYLVRLRAGGATAATPVVLQR